MWKRQSSGICYYYRQVVKLLSLLIFCFTAEGIGKLTVLTVLTNKLVKLYFVCVFFWALLLLGGSKCSINRSEI